MEDSANEQGQNPNQHPEVEAANQASAAPGGPSTEGQAPAPQPQPSQAVPPASVVPAAGMPIPPGGSDGGGAPITIDGLMDIDMELTVEIGRTRMLMKDVLELQKGSVVELNRIAGEVVDVFINEHLMAHGEIVVVDDKYGVRITDIVSPT